MMDIETTKAIQEELKTLTQEYPVYGEGVLAFCNGWSYLACPYSKSWTVTQDLWDWKQG
jgi:hypothetical protein